MSKWVYSGILAMAGIALLAGTGSVMAGEMGGGASGSCSSCATSACYTGACKHHCPPYWKWVSEGPPKICYKCGCPRPVCDPCSLEHFGYYQTCWQPWPYPPDWSHCPSPPPGDVLPPPPYPPYSPKAPRNLPQYDRDASAQPDLPSPRPVAPRRSTTDKDEDNLPSVRLIR